MREPQPAELDLPPLSEPTRTPWHRWMSRLAFTYVIVTVLLIWKAAHPTDGSTELFSARTKQVLCIVGAICTAILAIIGVRARHARK